MEGAAAYRRELAMELINEQSAQLCQWLGLESCQLDFAATDRDGGRSCARRDMRHEDSNGMVEE
jgi:hypothetical protein